MVLLKASIPALYFIVNAILALVIGFFVYALLDKDKKGYNFASHIKYSILSWIFLFAMSMCSKCESSSDYDDEPIHMFRP